MSLAIFEPITFRILSANVPRPNPASKIQPSNIRIVTIVCSSTTAVAALAAPPLIHHVFQYGAINAIKSHKCEPFRRKSVTKRRWIPHEIHKPKKNEIKQQQHRQQHEACENSSAINSKSQFENDFCRADAVRVCLNYWHRLSARGRTVESGARDVVHVAYVDVVFKVAKWTIIK